MTDVRRATEQIERLRESIEEKDNPDEWYLVVGHMIGEWSVHDAEKPECYDEAEQELPPEDRDASENIDGLYQVGNQSWSVEAFEEDCDFVEQVGFGGDEIDHLNPMLLVHESKLSGDALEFARENEQEQEQEARTDG